MEIKTRKELKKIIKKERQYYLNKEGIYQLILNYLKKTPKILIWKYIKRMRKTCYYYGKRKASIIYACLYLISSRHMNKLGNKIGFESGENVFDEDLIIYHSHGTVINGCARVGKHCSLYGNNCIGNNGLYGNDCPIIGDNVRIGVGAKIIGGIKIANNITIAAGAVVVDSFEEEGITIGGVPAKKIKN